MIDLKTIADELLSGLDTEEEAVEEIDIYENASELTGIDSNLLRSIDYGETGMGKSLVSPTGVSGHGQLTQAVAKKWGKNRDIPKEAIEGSALEIQDLLKRTGNDLEKALAAYNGGLGTVQQAEKLAAKKGTYWKDELINTKAIDSVANRIIKNKKNPGTLEHEKFLKSEEMKNHGQRILKKYKDLGGEFTPQEEAEIAGGEFSLEDIAAISEELLEDVGKPVTPEDLLFQRAVEEAQKEISREEMTMKPLKITPSKPTTDILGIPGTKKFRKMGKEISADVDLGIARLEEKRGAKNIPPHTGELDPNTQEYKDAVINENTEAIKILRENGVENKSYEAVKDFVNSLDFRGLQYPSQDSLESRFPDLEPTDYNNLRSYIARLKNAMHQDKAAAHKERAEDIYSMDNRIADLTEAYEDTMDYPSVIQGWKQGNVDAEYKKLLGVMAFVDPQKAAELVGAHNDMDAMVQEGDADKGKVNLFIKGFARMLQPMVETGVESAVIGAATGPVGGVASALYSLSQWGAMPMGSMFQDMVNQGVDPETASNTVLGFGLVHGAVEMAQVGKLKQILTGSGVTKKGVQKAFTAYVSKLAKGRVGDVAQEIAEEGVQGLIESFAVDFAKNHDGIDPKSIGNIIKDGFKNAVVAGVESAPHLIVLTLLTGGLGAAGRNFRQKLPPEDIVTFDEAIKTLKALKEDGSQPINIDEIGKTEEYQKLVEVLTKHKDILEESIVPEQIEEPVTPEIGVEEEAVATTGVEPTKDIDFEEKPALTDETGKEPIELGFISDKDIGKLVEDMINDAEIKVETEEAADVEFEEPEVEPPPITEDKKKKEKEDATGIRKKIEVESVKIVEPGKVEPEKQEGKEVRGDRQVRLRGAEKDRMEARKIEIEKRKEYENVEGFDKTLSPMRKESSLKTLNKKYSIDGKPKILKNVIRDTINSNGFIDVVDGQRRLIKQDGTYFVNKDISKIGMDYAEYLIKKDKPIAFQKDISKEKASQKPKFTFETIPKALWDVIEVSVGKEQDFKQNEKAKIESGGKKYKVTLNPKLDAAGKIRALAHEVGGHAGASNVLRTNKRLYKELQTLYEENGSDLKGAIEEQYSEEESFLEWIAYNIEEYMVNPQKEGVIQKVIRAIKRFLRKIGIGKAHEAEAFRELLNSITGLRKATADDSMLLQRMYARHLDSAEVTRLKKRYKALKDKMKDQWAGISAMRKDSAAAFKLANELSDKLLSGKDLKNEFNAFVYKSLPKTKQGRDTAIQRIFQKLIKMMVRERTKEIVNDAKTAFKKIGKVLKGKLTKDQKDRLKATKRKYPTVRSIKETDFDELLDDINSVEEMSIIAREKEAQARRDIKAELEAAVEQAEINIKAHGKEVGGEAGLTDSMMGTKLEGVYHNAFGVKALTIETIVEEMDFADVDESSASMGRIFVENFIGNKGAVSNKLRIIQAVEDEFKKEFSDQDMKDLKGMSIITPTAKQKFGRFFPGTKKTSIKLPSGNVLKGLNEANLIEFYLHGLSEHNREALLKDEITFDNKRFVQLTKEDVDFLTSEKRLSKLGLRIAKFIHRILNTSMKKHLEETSDTLPGKVVELRYNFFHLNRVERDGHLDTNPLSMSNITNDDLHKVLESTGALKSVKKGARGTVMIGDGLKTFFDSVNLTASFSAYARPLRLAKAMANKIEPTAKRYGYKRHMNEIKQYLRDIEAAQKTDSYSGFINKLIGNAVSATLGANIPVVLRQVGSYFSAGSEIGYDYLAKAAPMKLSVDDKANIRKHSPLIRARQDAAFINAELGGTAAQSEIGRVLGQGKNWLEYATFLIHKMDTAVINSIVIASKLQVEAEGNYTSEKDKWEQIAHISEKTMRRTQPMWAKEFRSGIGRTKGVHMRLLFAFTSATNALQNTMKRSFLKFKRTGDWQKLLLDLIMAWVGSAAFMVLIDYLRSEWLGYETSQFDNWLNLSRRLLAPFYLVEKASAPIVDAIQTVRKGRLITRTTEFATGNILSKYGIAFGKIATNVYESSKSEDFKAGDYDKLVEASVQTIHLLGMLSTGMPVENVWKYAVVAPKKMSEKSDTDISNAAKEVGYRPRIPETFTINKEKYRLYDEPYQEYQELVKSYAENIFSSSIYNRLEEKDRKKYIIKIYKQAREMAFFNFRVKENYFKLGE